ncbi:hypothetical protein SG34_000695 [Thalassomonas viridans]|uniref:Uncharacterized protein n=1 Tax=Thalassomonas viridans TaxID=137584 RepID=A0AAE9Z2B8_9GAMM|nr:hypothetical protein [Thalassomonas viridans]WDE05501.1 hypothetical protein SG34_000695 [Thalassomonas viridans]
MAKLALIFLGVCYAIASKDFLHVSLIINCSLLLIMWMNRDNINVVHLCGIMLAVYALEMVIFENFIVTESETMSYLWVNAIIFGTHFLVDLLLFVLVALRAPLTRGWLESKGKSHDHVFIHNSEFALTSLFVVFMFFDLLALGENFLRHLDKLGFSGEIVTYFADWTGVYYHYETVKSALLGLTFLLIWTMATGIGQDAYKAPGRRK